MFLWTHNFTQLFFTGIINNLTTMQWKNYCDTLYAVSVSATNVLKTDKPINFW